MASMPHISLGALGQNRSLVPLRLDGLRLPLRRQQLVLAHQAQHAPQGGAHVTMAQPKPTPCGNPVAVEAALATIELLEQELVDNAA
ncbi:MAG: hypothetical protein ACP5UT_18465, partial [Bryobacteraceae bacterium]